MRDPLEQAREPGVGDSAPDHARIVAQVRAAAHAFAAGRDGTSLAPPEIGPSVAEWRQSLLRFGEPLELEGWLLGLLTLACLSQRDTLVPNPLVPSTAAER